MTEREARRNPFPGLRPFRSDESYLFFGREGQGDELLGRLRSTRFLAVVGSSGSGKSSLVNAGLLPALHAGFMPGSGATWRVAAFSPGGDPIGELAGAIGQSQILDIDDGEDDSDSEIRDALTEATLRSSGLGLAEIVRQARMPADERLLVVVDQFEELFRFKVSAVGTRRADDSAAFVKLLLEASRATNVPVFVVLTMRSDFLGDCAQFDDLPGAIDKGQYLIPRLTREQRRQAIVGPVAVGGAEIAPRLVQHLLNDLGDSPDQLPIFQHALMRTWDIWLKERAGDEPLDLVHYEQSGGMAEALSRHADEVYAEFPDDRSREIAETMLKRLTELGDDNREIRRPTRLIELCAVADASEKEVVSVIESFRQPGRTFLMPPAGTPITDDSVVDISHESLMRVWKRLRMWVEHERESAQRFKRLSQTALLHSQGQEGLLTDPALQLLLDWRKGDQPTSEWAARYAPDFVGALRFLEESRVARQLQRDKDEARSRQELENAQRLAEVERRRAVEQTRASVRLQRFSLALIVVSMLAVGAAVLIVWQSRVATSRQLTAQAQRVKGTTPELALLLALQAEDVSATDDVKSLISEISTDYPPIAATLSGHSGAVESDARSLDGTQFVSGSSDSSVIVASGESVTTLSGHSDRVRSVAWSPDGSQLASGFGDSNVIVWDVASGETVTTLSGHSDWVRSVAWSPDGSQLASGSGDSSVIVWDVASGESVTTLSGHSGWVRSVAWSPDGSQLASGSDDSSVIVWDVASRESVTTLSGHSDWVRSVAWSPDGSQLASGSGDSSAIVWDVASGESVTTLSGHSGSVLSVAWSPDGSQLASRSNDSSAIVWDVASVESVTTLSSHSGSVLSDARSPDGSQLASGSNDSSVIVWDVASGESVTTLSGHSGSVLSVAWSPDGSQLASGSGDSSVIVWDVASGESVTTLSGHSGWVRSVAWSPDGSQLASGLSGYSGVVESVARSLDGTQLASGSSDSSVIVWDAASRESVTTLSGHSDGVRSVAWSPDGTQLASGSLDSSVIVWDVASGESITTLRGHSDRVLSVAWSPDGSQLASGSDDSSVNLYDNLVAACELVTRNLTPSERSEYLPPWYLPPFHRFGATCPNHPFDG